MERESSTERFSHANIERLVRGFYGKVRDDPTLGPIFGRRIDGWEPHRRRMSERGYQPRPNASPPELHQRIAETTRDDFRHWLGLFEATASEVFDAEEATTVVARATRIAERLSAHLPADGESPSTALRLCRG